LAAKGETIPKHPTASGVLPLDIPGFLQKLGGEIYPVRKARNLPREIQIVPNRWRTTCPISFADGATDIASAPNEKR